VKRTSHTVPGASGHQVWTAAVASSVVGGEVAEEVVGQRRRPQEIGPQPLVIEALVTLDDRCQAFAASSAAR